MAEEAYFGALQLSMRKAGRSLWSKRYVSLTSDPKLVFYSDEELTKPGPAAVGLDWATVLLADKLLQVIALDPETGAAHPVKLQAASAEEASTWADKIRGVVEACGPALDASTFAWLQSQGSDWGMVGKTNQAVSLDSDQLTAQLEAAKLEAAQRTEKEEEAEAGIPRELSSASYADDDEVRDSISGGGRGSHRGSVFETRNSEPSWALVAPQAAGFEVEETVAEEEESGGELFRSMTMGPWCEKDVEWQVVHEGGMLKAGGATQRQGSLTSRIDMWNQQASGGKK